MRAFLLIGQSNMSGRGVIGDLPAIVNTNVKVLRGGEWQDAVEPIVRDRPFSGEGMTLTFADAVNRLTGDEIGLLPCSLGGTPISEWAVGKPLYCAALDAVKQALRLPGVELSGILWHQGETDADDAERAGAYCASLHGVLDSLVRDIRAACPAEKIAQNLPIIVGEIGYYLTDRADSPYIYYGTINDQLHRFAAETRCCACVSARGLTDKGDGLHFSTRSLRRLGLRYADAYADLLFDK